MRKGRDYPHVQTRWTMGALEGRDFAPPVFISVDFTALMVWPVDDPRIPVPITGADCTIGQYMYETGDGACVWGGRWENFWGSGDWHFSQSLEGEDGPRCAFVLYYGVPSFGFYIARLNALNIYDGLWGQTGGDTHGVENFVMPSYPFVFLSFPVRAYIVRYPYLIANDIPYRDTKPFTFVYAP